MKISSITKKKQFHNTLYERRKDMQLLEQLAINDMVVPDMVQECYSVLGYLQCMEEFVSCSSDEYVTEGISVKEIFNRIWEAIKSIFGKIRKVINDFITFIKSKIMKSANDKLDEIVSSASSEKPQATKSQSGNANKYSLQGKIDQIYKQNPFTGVCQAAITTTMKELDEFIGKTLESSYRESLVPLESIGAAIDILGGNGPIADDMIKKNIDELSNKLPSDPKALIGNMMNFDSKWGKSSKMKKEVNSPQDFEKIPSMIYNSYRNGYGGLSPYKNEVLDSFSFKKLQDQCKEAAEAISKYSKSIISSLEDARSDNDYAIKKCKDMEKSVNEISMADNASCVTKILNQSVASLNIVSQCVTYCSVGFSKAVLLMDSDLDNASKYVKKILIKIADATFK